MLTDTQLLKYANKCFDIYRKATFFPLNHHDWEDIRQETLIHIYNKRNLRDESRPYKPWVKTVVSNQIKNQLRNNYAINRTNKLNEAGLRALKNAKPIYTKLVQNGIKGEEVVYEPDMANQLSSETIAESLTDKEKKFVDLYDELRCWTRVAKHMKIKPYEIKLMRQKLKSYL